jgi:hypothetical protein
MLSCNMNKTDDMTNKPAEERRKTKQREPRRDPRSAEPPLEPIVPPLIVDGKELVRDSHC